MALTAAMVSNAISGMRSALPCATVSIRHKDSGATYSGVRSTLEANNVAGSMGAIQGADGAVRLIVSELTQPYPKAGDIIEIQENMSGDWLKRLVLTVRYDQARASMRIDYGAEYD